MKKTFITIFLLLLFIPSVIATEFWASKNSNKYHYPDCRWAQKIKSSNLIKFKTPEEAKAAGYVPCKVCKPPVASQSKLNKEDNSNLAMLDTNTIVSRSGCCSWHGGQCGCDSSTGRVVCCDGTLSPSCTCW